MGMHIRSYQHGGTITASFFPLLVPSFKYCIIFFNSVPLVKSATTPNQTMASTASLAFLARLLPLSLWLTSIPCTDSVQPVDLVRCSSSLLLLAPCTGFVQGAAPAPNNACCSNLISIYHGQPGCLCPLLDRSLALPVNHTLALQLPRLCGFNLTGIANICPLVVLPPMGSPQPQPPSEMSDECSSSPAEVVVYARPRRVDNLPVMNAGSGKRMRARVAVVAMVFGLSLMQRMALLE